VGVTISGVGLGAGGKGVLVGGTIVLAGVAELPTVGVLVGVAVGVIVRADADPRAVGVALGVGVMPSHRLPCRQATADSCGEPTSEDPEEAIRE
jgi:hypothetical protein